ncbi:PBSX family phage terminase large subunit [Streptococcus sp. H31]|uniref:PBSX family phage terminase large subunit n=1 Tax=Streptococcus huangxiaojuni TaxID=3237239 RepID=UPI0034A12177
MTEQLVKRVSMTKVLGSGYNRFFHCRNFYRVVKGGRASKKSKTAALCHIHDILKFKWANLLVVRRYSNTNKQSTYTDLKWATNQLGVSDLFQFNESLPEITVKATGQKILFRGLDDPLKITSITVDVGILSWLWVEEAYQIETQEKFETLIESIRGSVDDPTFYKQVTITFNPWSERHWLKSAFFDKETRKKDVFALTTTYKTNEWLDEQDIERYEDLWRTNPRRAAIVANGDWGVAEGLVFDNYEVRDFNITETIKRVGETTAGLDFGFTNDPTTFPRLAVDLENKELWIYAEHYEHAMTTQDIFDMVERENMLKSYISADSAEQRLISELRAKGVRGITASIKGRGSINAGIDFMKQFKIIIHPSCTKTIEEFDTYVYKRNEDGEWLNEPVDANNHIIDAIRYALEKYHIQNKKIDIDKTLANVKGLF